MARRLVLVAVATAVAGLVAAGPAHAALERPAQSDQTTTTSDAEADENPLLVPGPSPDATDADADADGSSGDDAEVDGADPATDAAQDDPAAGSSNDEAEATVRLVMFALIGVAGALTLLTVYYWWRTRPARRPVERRRRGETPLAGDPDDASADTSDEPSGSAEPPEPRRSTSRPGDDDTGTVGAWQTDSTSTR